MALEQRLHRAAVPDVGLDELVLRPSPGRRPQIDVDDLLGLLARRELVGETAADVSRAACDQVPHGADPILAGQPMSTSGRSPSRGFGKAADFAGSPASTGGTATSCDSP